jgi:exosortase
MVTRVEPDSGNIPRADGQPPPVDRSLLLQIAVTSVLLLIAFWPILEGIYGSWFDQYLYMEHGILVVPAAAYMVWTNRERLKKIPRQPSAWGVALIALGAIQALFGTAAQWVWLTRMSFLVSLVGCVALWFGFRMVRALGYPLCVLLLMIAPPTFIYERLTLSLQLLASRIGENSLTMLGFSVLREGNVLELVGVKLSVAEACSGIRSLLAILFMCAIYNYFFVEQRTIKLLIFAMAIPIAILANAGRIVATGIASQYDLSLISGTAHETFGYISVAFAAVGCMGLHVVMLTVQKAWRIKHG